MPFCIFSAFVERIVGVASEGDDTVEDWVEGIDGVCGAVLVFESENIW
jgi:hypothetical protein